jgi:Gon7 family
MATDHKQAISASYASPRPPTSQIFRHKIATVLDQEGSVANKKEYLTELRGLVTLVQAEINIFLTERMEEDKQREGGGSKDAEQEAEEQNYGEENVEDDDA